MCRCRIDYSYTPFTVASNTATFPVLSRSCCGVASTVNARPVINCPGITSPRNNAATNYRASNPSNSTANVAVWLVCEDTPHLHRDKPRVICLRITLVRNGIHEVKQTRAQVFTGQSRVTSLHMFCDGGHKNHALHCEWVHKIYPGTASG